MPFCCLQSDITGRMMPLARHGTCLASHVHTVYVPCTKTDVCGCTCRLSPRKQQHCWGQSSHLPYLPHNFITVTLLAQSVWETGILDTLLHVHMHSLGWVQVFLRKTLISGTSDIPPLLISKPLFPNGCFTGRLTNKVRLHMKTEQLTLYT
jgi:hypothetical protein